MARQDGQYMKQDRGAVAQICANFAALKQSVMTRIPSDPFILLSYINTQLRNRGESLDELCKTLGLARDEVEALLVSAGFEYSEEHNKFW